MLAAVDRERVAQQRLGVSVAQVGLTIVLPSCGGSSTHHHTIAAFVEDLCDRRMDEVALGCVEERDADEQRRQVRRRPDEAPRHATGLVVQRGMEVPGAGGFVLHLAGRATAPSRLLDLGA